MSPEIAELPINTEANTSRPTSHGVVIHSHDLVIRTLEGNGVSFQTKTSGHMENPLFSYSDSVLYYQGQKIDLPKPITTFIAKYLSHESLYIDGSFDCISFVHHAKGLTGYGTSSQHILFNEFIPMKEQDLGALHPGDILVTGDTEAITTLVTQRNGDIIGTHWSMYIGNGLFLSKFGGTGRIRVSNISELKNAYPFAHMVKAEKRRSLGNIGATRGLRYMGL